MKEEKPRHINGECTSSCRRVGCPESNGCSECGEEIPDGEEVCKECFNKEVFANKFGN